MKKIKEYYLLTGASKGIGKAFLELLIKNDCFVLVLVRNKKDMIQYKNNKRIIWLCYKKKDKYKILNQ